VAVFPVVAISAAAVLNSVGVNTHFDSLKHGYENLPVAEAAIKYLGVKNLRDSAQSSMDLTLWPKVTAATGAHFADYMGRNSPAVDQTDLGYVPTLAKKGVLNYVEGGDENDTAIAVSLGNSIAWTANFQKQVYSIGHSLGLPVINMSFGAGWTADNNWHGNYDKVGDLSAYADYANAHTYPNVGQTPAAAIKMLNADALLAARSRKVITTEIGWDANKFSTAAIANYVLDAVFDGIKQNDVKMYFYALFDDGSGNYGLMNANGTPKPAGAALHNLTTILADPAPSSAASLNYSVTGSAANDNAVLIHKSTGPFELAVWNELDAPHAITVNLATVASRISLYDPIKGTAAMRSIANTRTITFTVPNHPVIVEVVK
jgi:hypothetical protein